MHKYSFSCTWKGFQEFHPQADPHNLPYHPDWKWAKYPALHVHQQVPHEPTRGSHYQKDTGLRPFPPSLLLPNNSCHVLCDIADLRGGTYRQSVKDGNQKAPAYEDG